MAHLDIKYRANIESLGVCDLGVVSKGTRRSLQCVCARVCVSTLLEAHL